ncbi:HFR063Wp [Eremothecium sinecaudum]|uniref:HFR063Wp n=1 Tax=Eremothecium sinecaudum TaxID=45286 RepID=A0A109V0I1_9SACH|nr:HFR063Wp [Eremothecium sinecaudum]AMD21918.1 HFR063Wp [Eremothecium sinecaudum]
MHLAEIARDITRFTLQNVNDAISFKPHLCHEVPPRHYETLRQEYISFTGTSIRKNKCKLFYLPTNVSDELQLLNLPASELLKVSAVKEEGEGLHEKMYQEIDPQYTDVKTEGANGTTGWGYENGNRTVFYKKRLITELDYENVKRVEKACLLIAYAAANQCLRIETCDFPSCYGGNSASFTGYDRPIADYDEGDRNSTNGEEYCEECARKSLERGEMLGFRELGYLINITPWHFHRVFKIIAGLTIREYGQLCCDFLKGQEAILFRVRDRVSFLRDSGETFSCLEDEQFTSDDAAVILGDYLNNLERGNNGVDIVILPDYFIDPNKSKELKKKLKEQKCNGSCADSSINRVEVRKRRYSLMSQRIMEASTASIENNPTIMDCLENSTLTRDEYERRQKQRHLQRSKLKKRKKSTIVAPSIRKPDFQRRPTMDTQNMLKSAVVRSKYNAAAAAAAAVAAAGPQEQSEVQHQQQQQLQESGSVAVAAAAAAAATDSMFVFSDANVAPVNEPSASSASSTSSALLSSYECEHDSHSLGHFSSPTQSVLDFKFPTVMSGDEAPSAYSSSLAVDASANNNNAAVNSTAKGSSATGIPPVPTMDSSSESITADLFADSYKYTLGASPAPSAQAERTGAAGIYYDSGTLPPFPVNTDIEGSVGITQTPRVTSSTPGPNTNYNFNSIAYTGGPQQQMLDFGPLFGAGIPTSASNTNGATNYNNTTSLGSMDYLISSSTGFFKEDEGNL